MFKDTFPSFEYAGLDAAIKWCVHRGKLDLNGISNQLRLPCYSTETDPVVANPETCSKHPISASFFFSPSPPSEVCVALNWIPIHLVSMRSLWSFFYLMKYVCISSGIISQFLLLWFIRMRHACHVLVNSISATTKKQWQIFVIANHMHVLAHIHTHTYIYALVFTLIRFKIAFQSKFMDACHTP